MVDFRPGSQAKGAVWDGSPNHRATLLEFEKQMLILGTWDAGTTPSPHQFAPHVTQGGAEWLGRKHILGAEALGCKSQSLLLLTL